MTNKKQDTRNDENTRTDENVGVISRLLASERPTAQHCHGHALPVPNDSLHSTIATQTATTVSSPSQAVYASAIDTLNSQFSPPAGRRGSTAKNHK